MSNVTLEQLEQATDEIMAIFDVDQPPVPIELMIERPREGLWTRADLADLTSSFLVISDRYSPRMSVARLLARHIARSEWGVERGFENIYYSKELTNQFARTLLMPRGMMAEATESGQSSSALVNRFEVPTKDFHIRLEELGINID